jgi:hypothetical protein
LANPATEYPRVFGKINLFREYPYALPTFVTGAVGAVATMTSAIGVKEASRRVFTIFEALSLTRLQTLLKRDKMTEADAPKKMSMLELLQSPNIPITLYLYGHIMILAFSYTAIVSSRPPGSFKLRFAPGKGPTWHS